MTNSDITEKALPALRLAACRTVVAHHDELASFVGPAFGSLAEILGAAGFSLAVPVAQYDQQADGLDVIVGYEYSGPDSTEFEVIELPAAEHALCLTHLGTMERIGGSWQRLQEHIRASGRAPVAPCREFYLHAPPGDQSEWVTELQQPVAAG